MHHPGQLEFLMAMFDCLDVQKDQVYFQIDSKNFMRQVDDNIELKKKMEAEFHAKNIIGFPFGFSSLSFWINNSGRRLAISKNGVKSLFSSMVIFFLKNYYRFVLGSIGAKRLFLINAPLFDERAVASERVFRFSTPISPSLVTYHKLQTGLAPYAQTELVFYGDFPSPTLSREWTKSLNEYFALPFDEVGQSDYKFLLLADRTPDTDNLTLAETKLALSQIAAFIAQNQEFRVIYRRHPRWLDYSSSRETDLVYKILKGNAIPLKNHLRSLAGISELMISFGGTAGLESICANCPVVEVVSQRESLHEYRPAVMSSFGLFEGVPPAALGDKIRFILARRKKYICEQKQEMCVLLPEFQNMALTKAKILALLENEVFYE